MAAVWSAAIPHLVGTADGIRAALTHDDTWRRTRTVAVADGRGVGTAVARMSRPPKAAINLAVHPETRGNGIGSALLEQALDVALHGGYDTSQSIANQDGIPFARRHGCAVTGEHYVSHLDTGAVRPPGTPPEGLELVRCDRLPNLDELRETHNLCAADDPSGHSETYSKEEFDERWWDSPENAPDLSWALLDDDTVAAFSNVQVDHDHARAWSGMTATHPSYRQRGLAGWLKRVTLTELAAAGISDAWTANDEANAPMLAVNAALGYRQVASTYTGSPAPCEQSPGSVLAGPVPCRSRPHGWERQSRIRSR